MKKRILISIVVLSVLVVSKFVKYFYGYLIFGKETWKAMNIDVASSYVSYSQLFLVFIALAFLFKKNPLPLLGLDREWKKGLFQAFLFVLPMLIGFAILQHFRLSFSWVHLHRYIFLAGFYEEVFYRGFLFGILFFYAGWGFIPAVIVPSLFFGLGHLYQADNFNDAISIFLFTALANAGFAWFYFAWNSLWMLVFLHGFMDLVWDIFGIETNVTGNLSINLFRFTTLGLVIYFSRKKLHKENRTLKDKLWKNVI